MLEKIVKRRHDLHNRDVDKWALLKHTLIRRTVWIWTTFIWLCVRSGVRIVWKNGNEILDSIKGEKFPG